MSSRALAGVHMLVAVLFNVIIIGLGMRDFGSPITVEEKTPVHAHAAGRTDS